jgi:uncharacterized membrane protein YdbT with pleckstrin-like domain
VGYPVLADDEQLVLHRHPHHKRLIPAVLALLLATALAAFVAGLVHTRTWDPTAENVIVAVIWAIWAVVVGWLSAWPFLGWLTTHFVITDQRVMYRHGVLTRTGLDLPLARIVHMEFSHRIIDRLLGTGTLVIESASQEPLAFHDIPRVQQVHSLLYHEVFDTLESDESSS